MKSKVNYQEWLDFAEDDLKAAGLSLNQEIENVVCFHSHQAVEKGLKALFLIETNQFPPKTHDLLFLLKKVIEAHFILQEDRPKINFLNQFYIPSRYPAALPGSLPERLPNEEEAQKAYDYAQEILEKIKKIILKIRD